MQSLNFISISIICNWEIVTWKQLEKSFGAILPYSSNLKVAPMHVSAVLILIIDQLKFKISEQNQILNKMGEKVVFRGKYWSFRHFQLRNEFKSYWKSPIKPGLQESSEFWAFSTIPPPIYLWIIPKLKVWSLLNHFTNLQQLSSK